ncbi:MAG: rhomboid family intramembrane serine protease [Pseudomonadota bacterium]|nr:rhomboid family intramembrane serine protease [Pseudomonadota bacterium]
MIKAASLEINVDLRSYSQFLHNQSVNHRIIEESGKQILWVNTEQEAQFVAQSLQRFLDEKNIHSLSTGFDLKEIQFLGKKIINATLGEFLRSPITMGLASCCLIIAIVSQFGNESDRVRLLFYPAIASSSLIGLLGDLSNPTIILRTLTPMFLHFGELHLIFNILWLWYFGKQLEAIHPVWIFLGLILLISFVSNTTQYIYIGYNNFGGMSGVVYGLVAYTWVIRTFMPRSRLVLNTNMFVFFVVALVLMEIFASSWIATAAHVGGLGSGLLLGVSAVMYHRFLLKRSVIGGR